MRYFFLDGIALLYHDGEVMKKPKLKTKRNVLALDLPPELKERIERIAKANGLPNAAATRMCLNHGLTILEEKLTPAALPS